MSLQELDTIIGAILFFSFLAAIIYILTED